MPENSMRVMKVIDIIYDQYGNSDMKGSLIDCMTDIRHFCDQQGIDFDYLIHVSKHHHAAGACDGCYPPKDDNAEDTARNSAKEGRMTFREWRELIGELEKELKSRRFLVVDFRHAKDAAEHAKLLEAAITNLTQYDKDPPDVR